MSEIPLTKSSKRNRRTLWIVLIISGGLHLIGLLVFGGITIYQFATRNAAEFTAPDVVPQAAVPPPPDYSIKLDQQPAPPKVAPIQVTPIDGFRAPTMTVAPPQVGGTRMGGGYGTSGFGGLGMGAVAVDFFGTKATGNNIVIILDATHSGAGIFAQTRRELLKTIEQMRGTDANLMVVYFGGNTAGHVVGRPNVDPTKADFWYPWDVDEHKWLSADGEDIQKVIDQLNSVDPRSNRSKVRIATELKAPDQFFVLGTQFWGAINDAFRMNDPDPNTIFFMVEPGVAFPNLERAKASYAWFSRYGDRKPDATVVQFVIGATMPKGDTLEGLRWMVNQLNGGDLTEAEIDERITTTG